MEGWSDIDGLRIELKGSKYMIRSRVLGFWENPSDPKLYDTLEEAEKLANAFARAIRQSKEPKEVVKIIKEFDV